MAKIFRWKAKGFGFTKIAKELNNRGVMTKRKKPFNIESVKYILRNHIYHGESNFGDIKSKGIHRPIISRRLFVRVQKKLDVQKEVVLNDPSVNAIKSECDRCR